jgi:hypothetical protein
MFLKTYEKMFLKTYEKMFLKTYEKMFLKIHMRKKINTKTNQHEANQCDTGLLKISFYTYLKLFLAGLDLKTFKSSFFCYLGRSKLIFFNNYLSCDKWPK